MLQRGAILGLVGGGLGVRVGDNKKPNVIQKHIYKQYAQFPMYCICTKQHAIFCPLNPSPRFDSCIQGLLYKYLSRVYL